MNKLSVIIPTLYKKPKVLYKLIEVLSFDECVSEIIIISNSKDEITFPVTTKINIYRPEQNLYVNSSWKKGIELAKEDNFLIINDDILVCEDFCNMVVNSEIFNKEETGLIGLNPYQIENYLCDTEDLEIPEKRKPLLLKFNKLTNIKNWGSAFFGKKENWYDIPDDLKIFYGDNYLMYKNILNHKCNYAINNVRVCHILSSTSFLPEFTDIMKEDIKNSKKYFNV